jgi:hypothetical protein
MKTLAILLLIAFTSCKEEFSEWNVEEEAKYFREEYRKSDSAFRAFKRDTSAMKEQVAYLRLGLDRTFIFHNVIIGKVGRVNIIDDYSFHIDSGWYFVHDTVRGQDFSIGQLKQISDLVYKKDTTNEKP